jgi:hypothetical protein
VLPGSTFNLADQLAAHPSGDLIVGGPFSQSVNLGGPTWTSEGLANPYVVGRLSGNDGHHVWSRALPETATVLAVDHNGDVVVVLALNYTLVIDGVRYQNGPARGAFVLVLHGDDGSVRWGRIVGLPIDDTGNKGILADLHLAVAPDGDLLLFGTLAGSQIFNDQTFAAVGDSGLVLARLAGSDGAFRWAKLIDGPGLNRAGPVGTGQDGRIIIAGSAFGSLALPGQAAVETADHDSFLAALEPDGQHVAWVRFLGGGFTERFSIQGDQLAVLGHLSHAIDLGTGTLLRRTP